jgi:cysteine sulfinate desulfinase/cysteine desulfurase-like protein
MIAFRDVLEPGLEEMGWTIIGKEAIRVPNTTFARVPRGTATHLMVQLGGDGVHVGLGSACGSLSTGPSPLMAAMGQGGSSHNYMRISQFGEYASKEAKLVLSKIGRYCPKGSDIP